MYDSKTLAVETPSAAQCAFGLQVFGFQGFERKIAPHSGSKKTTSHTQVFWKTVWPTTSRTTAQTRPSHWLGAQSGNLNRVGGRGRGRRSWERR